jgi:xanthine/uracil/vitamin C permease (AzgA family)
MSTSIANGLAVGITSHAVLKLVRGLASGWCTFWRRFVWCASFTWLERNA